MIKSVDAFIHYIRLLFKLCLSIGLTLFFIEIGLRFFPGVIPPDLLLLFAEKPRAEIAQRQGLPVRQDTVMLRRDDGGPELRLPRPFTPIIYKPENDITIQVVMDENGFCNPQGAYQRPTIDIITLGDSFTACHSVAPQETWTAQLGRLTGYSTYNLGRSGIGIHEYLQIFKAFGLQKSPRLVIMNIYEGNDLRDARNYYAYLEGEVEEMEPAASREHLLRRYSYAVNLIAAMAEYGSNLYFQLEENPIEQRRNYRFRLVFPEGVSMPFHNINTEQTNQARDLRAKRVEVEVRLLIVEALRTFVELAETHNFVPVVSYIPAASTAYEANAVFENPEFSELIPWFSREQRNFFKQQAEQLGYIFVDLTPAIQAAAQSYGPDKLLYYQYDIHLTTAGHAAVAEALSQRLQELAILSKN
jgi:hypothetical protein